MGLHGSWCLAARSQKHWRDTGMEAKLLKTVIQSMREEKISTKKLILPFLNKHGFLFPTW